MKKCKCCNIEKPLTEFHLDKKMSDGRFSECMVCRNTYAKKYYLENREIAKEKRLVYSRKNPKTKEQAHAAYLKRRDAALEYAKKRIEALSDSYMKCRVFGCTVDVEVPAELIEAKRLHMQIKRKLKELKT